ncbi:hypothetical protein A3Q56_00809 [Intoshia linei]|uniref:Uncharacterized protein n=1 Tax=Intoshia linei TaxID=1819745 RepID=A0A177BAR1_9BILA|nr:hypothetical protein A3Q56_00809 [Intoshia linei]
MESSKNITYHVPTIPDKERTLDKKEKGFILDGVAIDNVCKSYFNVNPKLGNAIPPYNSQKDHFCKTYFDSSTVKRVLTQNDQNENLGNSIEGPMEDRFSTSGPGFKYFSTRNKNGCGRSTDVYKGHIGQFIKKDQALSYNGELGYRRNLPHLREKLSCFDNHNPHDEKIYRY